MRSNVKMKYRDSRKNPIMPEEPDCVHLTERYKCNLLQVKQCVGTDCKFCQTAYERGKSFKRWQDVMNTMPDNRQEQIASTYYNGHMPWKDGSG